MKMHDNSQAVSESLGYIMIFGVVVACIAIMFVIGNQIIASNQASTSFQNMQQNFNIIQSNLMTTASGSSPVKTTMFNINYGTLSLLPEDESGNIIVIKFSGNEKDIPIGTLLFNATSSRVIALENGAVITSYDWDTMSDSLMTQEPRLFYSNNSGNSTLMICTVNVMGTRSSLSSSYASLKLKSGQLPSPDSYNTSDPDGESLEICVRTIFANAWKNYLVDIPGLHSVIDTTSPPEWVNVTLSDEGSASGKGIKKLIVVSYDVRATLG